MRTRSQLSAVAGGLLVLALATPLAAQDWRTLARSREYASERALRVDVEYGAGRLLVAPADKGVLYRTSLRYDADVFEPEMEYADNRLHVGIANGELRGRKNMKGGQLDVRLGNQAALDLQLKFGAAEARLDLSGMRVRSLAVSTGASATTLSIGQPNPEVCQSVKFEVGAARFEVIGIGNLNTRRLEVSGGVGEVVLDFTGDWRQDLLAQVHMGLGSLTLRVPRGLGLRVEKQGVLSGFDSEGLTKRGNVYYSENYQGAERKLGVNLEAAFGTTKVVWVDPD